MLSEVETSFVWLRANQYTGIKKKEKGNLSNCIVDALIILLINVNLILQKLHYYLLHAICIPLFKIYYVMRMKFFIGTIILSFVFLIARSQLVPTDNESRVHFVIKNFGIKTGGDLTGLKGTIKFDPNNPTASSFDVTVDASTIDTDNNTRDGHLKKEDYFDVNKFPVIKMVSTNILRTNKPGRYQFNGNLTIKSTTKSVSMNAPLMRIRSRKSFRCGDVYKPVL